MEVVQLLGLFCIALSWLIPIHFPPWTSFYNEASAAVGIILLAASLGNELWKSPWPKSAWILVSVSLIPAIQFSTAKLAFSSDFFVSSLYILTLACSIGIGAYWARSDPRGSAQRIAATVLGGAFLTAIVILAQILDVVPFPGLMGDSLADSRPVGNVGQPNNAATLIAFGLVGILLLKEQSKLSALTSLLFACPMLVALAATQSRTALLFGPVAISVAYIARKRGLRLNTGLFTLVGFIIFHWILAWSWSAIFPQRFSIDQTMSGKGFDSARLKMWPVLLDSLSNFFPMTGFGWLQVGEAELASINNYPEIGELWLHGHNIFLELMIWCGYPLGIVMSFTIIYWILSRLLSIRSTESVCAMMMLSFFTIHSLLELPYHYLYFLVPVGLLVGQVEVSHWSPLIHIRRLNLLPAVVAVLLAICLAKDYPDVEDDFRLVRFEVLRIGNVKATAMAPNAPFLSSLTTFLRWARTKPTGTMSPEKLSEVDAITKRYPYSLMLYRDATALALMGRAGDAEARFKNIRKIFGDGTYEKMRNLLKEDCASGQASPGLGRLLEALPSARS